MTRSADTPTPDAPLRCGYTTGACAAAAAKGAVQMLVCQQTATQASITLPGGNNADFELHGQCFTTGSATCFVVKDAGDDPDVTNGVEVRATVTTTPPPDAAIDIIGGVGIGRVTKPGLAVPPGEWAINPVPRRMIEQAVRSIAPTGSFRVAISIPDGAERAKKTLNERLGIMGGLSILGTTGIVRPVSAKAWIDTIDAALDVARACGCATVVLSTGRTSESAAQSLFMAHGGDGHAPLAEEAFVMMGDHIAHAVRAAALRGFHEPLIACQFAKLLKIACGHANTHAAASQLDLAQLLAWARDGRLPASLQEQLVHAHTAREAVIASGFSPALLEMVARRAGTAAAAHSPESRCRFLVCGYEGQPAWLSK